MVHSAAGDTNWSIDWFRHCRELIVPPDYLTRSYIDPVDAHLGCPAYPAMSPLRSSSPGDPLLCLDQDIHPSAPKRRKVCQEPAQVCGAGKGFASLRRAMSVRGKMSGHSGHNPVARCTRGRKREIFAHHGGHILPDASASGEKAEHLYTVRFAASELWPEAEGRLDRVFIDLLRELP
jgi:nitrile hydratase